MIELEGKIVRAGDVLEMLRADTDCPERTKSLVRKYLEKALRKAPFHRHQIDVNEMVCMFPDSTDIHIHMQYADDDFTHAHWDEDAAGNIWKGGDRLNGMTRYPIGDCVVKSGSVFIPAKYGMKANYDVSFVAYEPFYSEKLRRKWAQDSELMEKEKGAKS